MRVNYSNQDVIIAKEKSIFLAGPTPRTKEIVSWRKEAIRILEILEFEGVVYYPEYDNDQVKESYVDQAVWERKALQAATCILFWVDRNLICLPGFTTNVEFGYWIAKKGSRVVYGRPNGAPKTKYLDWLYQIEQEKDISDNLEDLVLEAIICANEKRIFGSTEREVWKILEKSDTEECMEDCKKIQETDEYFKEKARLKGKMFQKLADKYLKYS